MCGICGVISNDKPAIEPAVRRMMNAMVHRGPDDEGFEMLNVGDNETGPFAGFGFRRLAILDLTSAGHQPMFNPKTGDCLIFNGEIYNFRHLRTQLQCEGVLFRGHSDTEVLLHALSRWGDAAVAKLQGMFAFAFYEARSRRILLARDPLGIKPLYVAESANAFVFASEVRALRRSSIIDDELDPAGVAGVLAYGSVQAPFTIHRSIRSFPAGHLAWYAQDAGNQFTRQLSRRRYWAARWGQCRDNSHTAVNTVRELMTEALLRHAVSDVPSGILLSAGLDSSILAALSSLYSVPLKAVTVGFSTNHEDESREAILTAQKLGLQHDHITFEPSQCRPFWSDWLDACDSPSVDGFNTYLACHGLRQNGITVGLSGLGADELFGGYSTFCKSPALAGLLRLLRPCRVELRTTLARMVPMTGARRWEMEKIADLLACDLTAAEITLALRRLISNDAIRAMMGNSGATRLSPTSERNDLGEAIDGFNQVSRMELEHYMSNTLLRDSDMQSMWHSTELRLPYLDLPVVDYVCSLPGAAKAASRGMVKPLLHSAFARDLPAHVLNRRKSGFTLPIWDWMLGPLRDQCEAAIRNLERSPLFDAPFVRRTWVFYVENSRRMHWSRPMALVSLGAYLR